MNGRSASRFALRQSRDEEMLEVATQARMRGKRRRLYCALAEHLFQHGNVMSADRAVVVEIASRQAGDARTARMGNVRTQQLEVFLIDGPIFIQVAQDKKRDHARFKAADGLHFLLIVRRKLLLLRFHDYK